MAKRMPRRPKKPGAIQFEDLRAVAERPPLASDTTRWWWRVRRDGRHGASVWTGRGTPSELMRLLADLHDNGPQQDAYCETVTDLLALWLGRVALQVEAGERRPATLRGYKSGRNHLRRLLGALPVESLTTPALRDYLTSRRLEGAADSTINAELIGMQAAISHGVERGYLPKSVKVPKIPKDKVKARRAKDTPTDAAVAELIESLTGWSRICILIGHGTGMRIGEIGHLRRGHLHLDDGYLMVPDLGKTGTRKVPLQPYLVDELRSWLATHQDDRVLARNHSSVLSTIYGFLAETNIRPHGLRRLAVNNMLSAGVPLHIAAQVTGHGIKVMMEAYAEINDQQLFDAVAAANLGARPRGLLVGFPDRKER
jgi:integrase